MNILKSVKIVVPFIKTEPRPTEVLANIFG